MVEIFGLSLRRGMGGGGVGRLHATQGGALPEDCGQRLRAGWGSSARAVALRGLGRRWRSRVWGSWEGMRSAWLARGGEYRRGAHGKVAVVWIWGGPCKSHGRASADPMQGRQGSTKLPAARLHVNKAKMPVWQISRCHTAAFSSVAAMVPLQGRWGARDTAHDSRQSPARPRSGRAPNAARRLRRRPTNIFSCTHTFT